MHKEATFEAFFLLFPTKFSCQLKRALLIEFVITDSTSNKEKLAAIIFLFERNEAKDDLSSPPYFYIRNIYSLRPNPFFSADLR